MASEVLCTRWTMMLMRELVARTTRFNDLRRGVPKMSPALLSTRLKELEAPGIVERRQLKTERRGANITLQTLARACGPSLLMWDMRRNLDPSPLPPSRTVVQFLYSDLASTKSHWWLGIEPTGEIDLCWSDPRFEINLYVTPDLRTMTAI
jgi:DNA-binding HxlR family transcriptional regulator